jgi:Lrp/AsnC family transcriptional regulator, regulator for asnA, asnC and gidA
VLKIGKSLSETLVIIKSSSDVHQGIGIKWNFPKVFRLENLDIYMKINNTIFVDDINLQIIDILAKDSSTTFVEIAKQIGISDATVHLRVRRLIAAGIITKFTISVDNNLLGYDHPAFMGINIKPGLADQITEELSNIEEVLEIHEMHNTFDLFLKIRAKDLNHMRDIIENKICKLPNILETELMTVLKTKKEEQIVSLKKDGPDNGNGVIHVKELKSHTIINEHAFWN